MATWVRANTNSPAATDDVPLPFATAVTLDNGTAPADFDPAGVTSVRIQWRLGIAGLGDDNWTDYQEANLGSTPLATVDGGNATRSTNANFDKDLTDNSPNTGQTTGTWEAATLVVGTNGAWALWNKSKGPDGTTATVSTVTVTITYTPAAGTDYTETSTDPVGVADVTSRVADFVRTATDPVGVIDATSRIVTFVRASAEPVGVTDAVASDKTITVTATDPVGVVDQVAAAKTGTATVTDPVGVTDATVDVLDAAGIETVTDPVAVTDATVRVWDAVREIVDPVGVTDTVTYDHVVPVTSVESWGLVPI